MSHSSSNLSNIRSNYTTLERNVVRALLTMRGDESQLRIEEQKCCRFFQDVEANRDAFEAEEYAQIAHNVNTMVNSLHDARYELSDLPDSRSIPVAYKVKMGTSGAPKITMDRDVLAAAVAIGVGPEKLRTLFGCSARTVRRRLLEYGLAEPGDPVCTTQRGPDGSKTVTHYTSGSPAMSVLSNEQLDRVVYSILEAFPKFGFRMLRGRLMADGHRVPRDRIRESYLRVNGALVNRFGSREVHRQRYHVAGANSLWHHDGQHGLIRYKLVIHCFVDGKSRMVTAIRVHNNNRASSVLNLFLEGVQNHGRPRRVRGDHGTENLRVAEWMEEQHGVDSYIWGRSVHNTRIERLWYDVTHHFGKKWRDFFSALEVHDGLNPNSPGHIWLLHHLFLFQVDLDAQEWAHSWNVHPMRLTRERDRSPREIFLFSQVRDGPRGISLQPSPPEEEVPDPATYGIDWEELDDRTLYEHYLRSEEHEESLSTHDDPGVPANLNHVPCEPPNCPFTGEQVRYMDDLLRREFDLHTRNLVIRRAIWRRALDDKNNDTYDSPPTLQHCLAARLPAVPIGAYISGYGKTDAWRLLNPNLHLNHTANGSLPYMAPRMSNDELDDVEVTEEMKRTFVAIFRLKATDDEKRAWAKRHAAEVPGFVLREFIISHMKITDAQFDTLNDLYTSNRKPGTGAVQVTGRKRKIQVLPDTAQAGAPLTRRPRNAPEPAETSYEPLEVSSPARRYEEPELAAPGLAYYTSTAPVGPSHSKACGEPSTVSTSTRDPSGPSTELPAALLQLRREIEDITADLRFRRASKEVAAGLYDQKALKLADIMDRFDVAG
ncbi:hypothetical protein V5O48_008995 [Marasmius crinis-equi]|uniref:Integrase core domain-containing protein n=1 Tax=Marasmius crinis-equi TaxID=585013 RepID=A0ABR3FCC0_9AGAR